MDPVTFVTRLFHILPAVLLAGGILFMWSSMLPGFGTLDEESRKAAFNAVRGKWAKVVMLCSALLIVTGLYNAVQNIVAYEYATPYHVFVLLKLVLGIGIMFITAKLSGRSASAEKFREKMPFWMTINAALVVVLIVIATTMKVSDKTPKPPKDEAAITETLDVQQNP